MSLQSQFSDIERIQAQADREMKGSPIHQKLRIHLQPTDEEGLYEFMLENLSGLDLWDVQVNHYELTGPGRFGWDDKYMRSPPDPTATIKPPALPAHTRVSLCRQRWGHGARYHPPAQRAFGLTYGLREQSSRRHHAMAGFVVSGQVPIEPHPQISTPSYFHFARSLPTFHRMVKFLGSCARKSRMP